MKKILLAIFSGICVIAGGLVIWYVVIPFIMNVIEFFYKLTI